MLKAYRESVEYQKRRLERLLRHRIKRKDKKHNSYSTYLIRQNKRFQPPAELTLFKCQKYKNNSSSIELTEVFSITKNPKETLQCLYKIASWFFNNSNLDISILCEHTSEMDLSALIILDALIVKGKKYINKLGYKCKISGSFPSDINAKELFLFSGLPKYFDLSSKVSQQVELLDPFSTIDETTLETHRIIDYYDNCLNRNGYRLNKKGKIYLFYLINEIVDNARIHNDIKGKFYCGGFYSHNTKKGQLSIISFGNTMYESLNSPFTSENIKKKIIEYINVQKKFFDLNYNEEMSWTVFALQYKISRFNNAESEDRGTGTIQFIEAFMNMGQTMKQEKPIMSLVSGNTHILFDGTYTLKEKTIKNEKVKVIAFNEHNDLKEKPDKNYVKDMKIKFPGVIINIEFFMDPDYLERFKEGDKNE